MHDYTKQYRVVNNVWTMTGLFEQLHSFQDFCPNTFNFLSWALYNKMNATIGNNFDKIEIAIQQKSQLYKCNL